MESVKPPSTMPKLLSRSPIPNTPPGRFMFTFRSNARLPKMPTMLSDSVAPLVKSITVAGFSLIAFILSSMS